MKLYIDESGNTGQPLFNEDGTNNFSQQPNFTLAGLLLVDDSQAEELGSFIDGIRKKYNIQGPELKAKNVYESKADLYIELFKKLEDMAVPIFIELNDKKMYLCIHLVNTFFLPAHITTMSDDEAALRRQLAQLLYRNLPEPLFFKFGKLCNNPTTEAFESMFEDLISYYTNLPDHPSNRVIIMSLTENFSDYKEFVTEIGERAMARFLPVPDKDKKDRDAAILPNVNAFSGLVARCEKYRVDKHLPELSIVHDEQKHFDEIIKETLNLMKKTDADELLTGTAIAQKSIFKLPDATAIEFGDSKEYKMIQIADLIAGFMGRAWDDFFNGRFTSLNRYGFILKKMFLPDNNGTTSHNSEGVNLVVPEQFYHLLLRHLTKL